MGVGVKVTVDEDHLDRCRDGVVGDLLGVEAGGEDGVTVVGLDTGDELGGQHALAGELAHHRGDRDAGQRVEVAREPARVVGLEPVVELEQQRGAELLDDLMGARVARSGRAPFGEPCCAGEDQQVRLYARLDVRALNLDGDCAAVGQCRAVHLPE